MLFLVCDPWLAMILLNVLWCFSLVEASIVPLYAYKQKTPPMRVSLLVDYCMQVAAPAYEKRKGNLHVGTIYAYHLETD